MEGNGAGATRSPTVSFAEVPYEIVEWRQTNLEEWYGHNIDSMEKAEAVGHYLLDVGEKTQLALGLLFLHVEKHKGGAGLKGGQRELARRLEIPVTTASGYIAMVEGQRMLEETVPVRVQFLEETPVSLYREIARSPEPEKTIEFITETVEETGKIPTYREVVQEVRKQKLGDAEFRPKIYDIWSFGFRDPRYGQDGYRWGLICGQIVENLLHYYTEEDDLVLDPMAGGGTTLDVCHEWNRRCLAFDIDPARDDIVKNDLTKGLPDSVRDVDLVILEPPYYNMKQTAYDSLEEYLTFLDIAIRNSADRLHPRGHLVLIVMDQVNKNLEKFPIVGPAYGLLEAAGLEYEHLVGLPLATEQYTAYHVEWARREKIMLGINRQMWIFRRPGA